MKKLFFAVLLLALPLQASQGIDQSLEKELANLEQHRIGYNLPAHITRENLHEFLETEQKRLATALVGKLASISSDSLKRFQEGGSVGQHSGTFASAHTQKITGKGVKIAVVERSGVRHGTHVANILKQIAPDADPKKLLLLSPEESKDYHIINFSLGVSSRANDLSLFTDPLQSGALVIKSAGNDSCSLAGQPVLVPFNIGVEWPSPIIMVGNLSFGNVPWPGSNVPGNNPDFQKLFIWTLGTDLYAEGYRGFERQTGTSGSAPVVTGVAALIMQQHPHFKPRDVQECILESALQTFCVTFHDLQTKLMVGTQSQPYETDEYRIFSQPYSPSIWGKGILDTGRALAYASIKANNPNMPVNDIQAQLNQSQYAMTSEQTSEWRQILTPKLLPLSGVDPARLESALYTAERCKFSSLRDLILGTPQSLITNGAEEKFAFLKAIINRDESAIKSWIQESPFVLNLGLVDYLTSVWEAIIDTDDQNFISQIFQTPQALDLMQKGEITPLHMIINKFKPMSILTFFLQQGTPLDMEDKEFKQTPLQVAIRSYNSPALVKLLEAGANISDRILNEIRMVSNPEIRPDLLALFTNHLLGVSAKSLLPERLISLKASIVNELMKTKPTNMILIKKLYESEKFAHEPLKEFIDLLTYSDKIDSENKSILASMFISQDSSIVEKHHLARVSNKECDSYDEGLAQLFQTVLDSQSSL